MIDRENFDIRSYLIDSIVELFDTMLSMTVELADCEPPEIRGINRIAGTVHFTGNLIAGFNFQVTAEFARLMTAHMLGIEPEEIENEYEINELITEISNIIGRKLKSALSDAGHPCMISMPSITYGSDFSIRSLNKERFERYVFRHQQDLILAEVGFKTQDTPDEGTVDGLTDAPGPLKEIDAEKINTLDMEAKVAGSLIEFFDTVLSMNPQMADSISASDLAGIRNVISVSFTGDAAGMINIHISDDFSRQMAAGRLAMEVKEIEDDKEIQDTFAELANIVGGTVKSVFGDAGLNCAISTPFFTKGTDFKIESLRTEKYERFGFHCDENPVMVEIGIKLSEVLQGADPQEKEAYSSLQDSAGERGSSEKERAEAEAFREPQLTMEAAPQKQKDFHSKENPKAREDFGLNLLLDIPLEIKVELGRTKIKIQELLKLASGSAIKLTKLDGEPVDILANDKLIARGEVVVQNQKYGIRVTEITRRMDRCNRLGW